MKRILLTIFTISTFVSCNFNTKSRQNKVEFTTHLVEIEKSDDVPVHEKQDNSVDWVDSTMTALRNNTEYISECERLLSSRIDRPVKCIDIIRHTYKEGTRTIFFNNDWNDWFYLPDGFEVAEDYYQLAFNFHGTSMSFASPSDTVNIFTYASYQVVWDSFEDMKESMKCQDEFESVSVSEERIRVAMNDGSISEAQVLIREGIKNGVGVYEKNLYSLPGSDIHYEASVYYHLPISSKAKEAIKSLKSYPNIRRQSEYPDM